MNTTKKITLSLIALLTLFFATSCTQDENPDLLPVLTTKLSSVDYKAVKVQGDITPTAGLTVIERGVCWSKRILPTVDSTKMIGGKGVGSFTCSVIGLTPDSTYYVRAYATSMAGTTYGNQVSFKVPFMIRFKPLASYDSLIDVDGNKYKTDTIGTQIWMCENLRVTKYRNGSPISNITSNADWLSTTTGAFCQYTNNSENVQMNGLLYNWYAVNANDSIAPEGWHVATATDWARLSTFLGGDALAGTKLKEGAHDNWNIYLSVKGTNTSGFSALPGGYRSEFNAAFYYLGDYGCWWTTTEQNATSAIYRRMNFNDGTIDIYNTSKIRGCSIRCVKN